MCPDYFALPVVCKGLFQFVKIQGFVNILSRDVVMHQHRKSFFGTQVKDLLECFAVDMRGFAVGKGSQIIVSAHDFSDALPEIRIELQHLSYMIGCVSVIAVNAANKGMEPFLDIHGLC